CARVGGTGVIFMDLQSQNPFDYW
nr:immunoglobulin heavy chain junction region [Macaca mulatta]MOW45975.1 immunoglobulin heavy chain junction region [Macaca mulatta]MOW46158.1 immunoglobulin heavy chain junction region [Macaca mulatta]MOW46489.1 immunoglobulin heavy chain junction region [Macaca mulatta]MOW46939.1 immunoglobulin heavy chain junction region [Macaca mulatta]